jgi:hypothetical protein
LLHDAKLLHHAQLIAVAPVLHDLWSKSLRDAEARLLWAEADLEASEKKARSEQRP